MKKDNQINIPVFTRVPNRTEGITTECFKKFQAYCCRRCGICPENVNSESYRNLETHFLMSDFTGYILEYRSQKDETKRKEILNRYWNEVGEESLGFLAAGYFEEHLGMLRRND